MERYSKYLNGIQLTGWAFVLVSALLAIGECPQGLLLITAVVQAMNGFDLWMHLSAGRRKVLLPWLLQNGARLLFVGLLWEARHLDIRFVIGGRADAASLLLIVWSLAELSRFLFYVFRTSVLRWLRYNSFLFAYPLGVAIELGWMYRLYSGIPFILGKILLILLFLSYLFGFPYLFLHLFRTRKQKLDHE